MKKFIHIGGDSRSGGSLLARLFDGHPLVPSYPFENEFFMDRNGALINFSKYRQSADSIDIENEEVVNKIKKFATDLLQTKQRYENDENKFDFTQFTRGLADHTNAAMSDQEIYDAIHSNFFKVHQNTELNKAVAVSNHCSRTFAADLGQFFKTFGDAYFMHTIREPKAVTASLKNYSFFATGKNPESIPDNFIDLSINRWLMAAYMAVKNRISFADRYLIVLYEDLILNDEAKLKEICVQIGLEFHEGMLTPTFGDKIWSGNSSFGKMPAKVSAKNLEKYKEVLDESEQAKVDASLEKIYKAFTQNLGDDEMIVMIEKELKDRIKTDLCDSTDLRPYFNDIYKEMRNLQIR
jgi:hypothetical protein